MCSHMTERTALLAGEAETNKLFQSRRIEAEIPQACIYRSLSFACG